MRIEAPTSPGDLIDRITILRIKAERIPDESKRANVAEELAALAAIREKHPAMSGDDILELEHRLEERNRALWTLEDRLRLLERRKSFGKTFIALARRVYLANDARAALKRAINDKLESEFREEKWFSADDR